MFIRELDKNQKVNFDEICNIVVDQNTRRVIHSNHPRIRPGHPISEDIQRNAIGHGWNVIRRNPDRLMTEGISVEDLVNQVILGSEQDGRWTVFESADGEALIFAQRMRDGQVCSEDEKGDAKWFDSVEDFLKSLPSGYVLSGVIDDENLQAEQEGLE